MSRSKINSSSRDNSNDSRKGTSGVSTNGVTANCMFLIVCFGVLPLAYFYLPKSARAYLFPQSVRIHYFCSGPISVDPICPQPRHHHREGRHDLVGRVQKQDARYRQGE